MVPVVSIRSFVIAILPIVYKIIVENEAVVWVMLEGAGIKIDAVAVVRCGIVRKCVIVAPKPQGNAIVLVRVCGVVCKYVVARIIQANAIFVVRCGIVCNVIVARKPKEDTLPVVRVCDVASDVVVARRIQPDADVVV